jgi:hypothetical protein
MGWGGDMTRRWYTDDQINRAVELREKGWGYEAIAEEVGMTAASASYHCVRLGAELPKPTRLRPNGKRVVQRGKHVVRRFTPEEDQKILAMAAAGDRVSDIANAIGRKINSVIGRIRTLARYEERTTLK